MDNPGNPNDVKEESDACVAFDNDEPHTSGDVTECETEVKLPDNSSGVSNQDETELKRAADGTSSAETTLATRSCSWPVSPVRQPHSRTLSQSVLLEQAHKIAEFNRSRSQSDVTRSTARKNSDAHVCAICREVKKQGKFLRCLHSFCRSCLLEQTRHTS